MCVHFRHGTSVGLYPAREEEAQKKLTRLGRHAGWTAQLQLAPWRLDSVSPSSTCMWSKGGRRRRSGRKGGVEDGRVGRRGHRCRGRTESRSASPQTVRHSHLWGVRNPRVLRSPTPHLDDPCDSGGQHGRSGPNSVRLVGDPSMASRGSPCVHWDWWNLAILCWSLHAPGLFCRVLCLIEFDHCCPEGIDFLAVASLCSGCVVSCVIDGWASEPWTPSAQASAH